VVVIVVQRDHTAAGLRGLLHTLDRLGRLAEPLQGPGRCHDVETAFERHGQSVVAFEAQIRNATVFLPGGRHLLGVAVDSEHRSFRPDRLGDPDRDRSRPAADVEHGHPRSQEFGQAPMIALQRPPIQDPRVRAVGLHAHSISLGHEKTIPRIGTARYFHYDETGTPMRLVLYMGLAASLCESLALGCSCVTTGSYCTALAGTQIVFVGRVVEDSGEGGGKGPARMAVEEVLHGLSKDIRELTVDTSAGTSCYMRLQKDERYVIYASKLFRSRDRVRRDDCSFSFSLKGNEKLLAALRDAQTRKEAALIGKVTVKHEEYDLSGEGASGLTVIATTGSTRLKTTTDADGQFEFRNVSPGTYHIETEGEDFFPDNWRWPSEDPSIHGASCGYQQLYVWPNGQIEGTVRKADGSPAAGVPVQAFAKDRKGELRGSPLREQKTNQQGGYTLKGLPPGEFAIGINGEEYSDKQPWRPTFFRGTSDRNNARMLSLGRGEHLSKIDLDVSDAREPATLHIEAVLEDGMPATDVAVRVEDLSGTQRAFSLGSDTQNGKAGRLDIPVYVGETYKVRCFAHSFDLPQPLQQGQPIRTRTTSWAGVAEPVQVVQRDVHIRIVLSMEKK
jgi:hypothetical protein